MKKFDEIWESCSEVQRLKWWNSLLPKQKRGVWNNLLTNPQQKLSLWNSLDKVKKGELWSLWEDSINAFWNSLEYPEREKFWNSLEISYKAEFLKILSENYTLAQIVFATRKRVEDRLRKEKCFKKYNIKNVYITLEELPKGEEGESGATAYIDPDIVPYTEDNRTLYFRIVYSTSGGIVEYDNKNYISRSCARFLVGHEIGHIFLHLENIIKNAEVNEGEWSAKLFKSPKEAEKEEKKADFFAEVISDLRDLYLLRANNEIVRGDEEVANSYNKKEYADIVKLALSISKESEKFTMSSYIFAAKKIISDLYTEENHRISEIYCRIKNDNLNSNIVYINRSRPKVKKNYTNFGYNIGVPNNDNTDTNTANGIGALLLYYDEIKNNKKSDLIPIDKKEFPMNKIKEFSDCLLKKRTDLIKKICQEMKSRSRLIKHKS